MKYILNLQKKECFIQNLREQIQNDCFCRDVFILSFSKPHYYKKSLASNMESSNCREYETYKISKKFQQFLEALELKNI